MFRFDTLHWNSARLHCVRYIYVPTIVLHYYSTCIHTSPEIFFFFFFFFFFFLGKKISGLEWESNPHSHISGVMLYQLSYQAPWEQGGGKEGIQVLVLGAHYIRRNFLLRNTPAVTMLSPWHSARCSSHQA